MKLTRATPAGSQPPKANSPLRQRPQLSPPPPPPPRPAAERVRPQCPQGRRRGGGRETAPGGREHGFPLPGCPRLRAKDTKSRIPLLLSALFSVCCTSLAVFGSPAWAWHGMNRLSFLLSSFFFFPLSRFLIDEDDRDEPDGVAGCGWVVSRICGEG